MIYTTCIMCYATFSYSKSGRSRTILGLGLLGLSIFITAYYHYLGDPVFHQVAYAILTIVVVFRSMWVMEVTLRPKWRNSRRLSISDHLYGSLPSSPRGDQFDDIRDQKVLRRMWIMVAVGISTFLGGFAIWNLDNQFCSTLRGVEKEYWASVGSYPGRPRLVVRIFGSHLSLFGN